MNKPDYDWWIANAHNDSAFLFLVEHPKEFEQAILLRLKQVGRSWDQGVINQAKWRAIHEQDRFGSLTSICEAIQPVSSPPSTPDYRPLHGDMEIDNHVMKDDEGHFLLFGVSAFWCPWAVKNNIGYLHRMTDWAVQSGMNYVRWFGAHDWEGGLSPDNTPDYFAVMEHTITALASRGLRSQITLFSRYSMVGNKDEEYIRQWADIINNHKNEVCLVEIANEWNHLDNGWSDSEIRNLGAMFRERCSVPLALSGAAGETWEDKEHRTSELYNDTPVDVVTCHYARKDNTHEGPWRWVRQPWHSRYGIKGCPDFVVDNEHQRWDRSNGGRIIEVATSAPVVAYIAGCGMTAHHDNYGVRNNRGEYAQDSNADALQKVFSSVMPMLPSDLPNWTATRVGDGGGPHPFPSLIHQHWSFEGSLDHGVSRAFAAVNQDKFVMALTGVKNHVTLNEQQHSIFNVVSLRDGEIVYSGNGPVRLNESDGLAFAVITE